MEQSGVSFRETGEPWLLRPTKLHRNALLQWDWLHDLLGRWKIGSFHFALPPMTQHHRLDRSTRRFRTCPVWLWGWSCCLGGCWSESLGMLTNRNDIGKDIRISWISLSWNRQMLSSLLATCYLFESIDLLKKIKSTCINVGRKWWRNMSNLFGAIRRGCSARVSCHEGPENQDDNGKSTIWRYISYWTSEFSIVMLVFREANGFDMRYWRFKLSFYGGHLLWGLTFQGFFFIDLKEAPGNGVQKKSLERFRSLKKWRSDVTLVVLHLLAVHPHCRFWSSSTLSTLSTSPHQGWLLIPLAFFCQRRPAAQRFLIFFAEGLSDFSVVLKKIVVIWVLSSTPFLGFLQSIFFFKCRPPALSWVVNQPSPWRNPPQEIRPY